MSKPSQSFIRDIIAPIAKELVENVLKEQPERPDMKFQIRPESSSARAGKKLTKQALNRFIFSKEGKATLDVIIEIAKNVPTLNTLRKRKDAQEQRADLKQAIANPSGELIQAVRSLRSNLRQEFIIEEPRGDPVRKVGRPKKGEPKVEKKAEAPKVEKVKAPPKPKPAEMKIVGVKFSRDEAKNARQALSERSRLIGPTLNRVATILQGGQEAVNRLFSLKNVNRQLVSNVAAGLALVSQIPNLPLKQQRGARNLARLVGAGAIARTSLPKFSKSLQDFDEDGNPRKVSIDRIKKDDPKEGEPEKDPEMPREPRPEPMPDNDTGNVAETKRAIDEMVETMQRITTQQRQILQEQSGLNTDNVIQDLRAQSAEIGETNQLTRAQAQLGQMARLRSVSEFLLALTAIAVGIGLSSGEQPREPQRAGLPAPEEPREPAQIVEVRPSPARQQLRTAPARPSPTPPRPPQPPARPPAGPITIFPQQRTATDARLRRRRPPRPPAQPLPAPPERLALPDPEEVRKEEERTRREERRKEKEKIFTSRQIVEQQDEEKKPQQARPDVIIPAQKILDPYKDEKDQKADFEIEAGFGFDIPFAINGVILENNALMQQHLMEQELIYRNAGIDRGNNDFDDPSVVGFEKMPADSSVPSLIFTEEYQDEPVNPNNTFKQNVLYNSMTPVLPKDGQANSLRKSTLFGEQPTF